MKITGFNSFSAAKQMQLLNELNLKDGQKVIGKIIGLATDEALLEIAGRPIQAKIEGNPPPAGTIQTFQVKTDDQGRIILKVLANPQETVENISKSNGGPLTNNNSETVSLQKAIINSLTKDGLPPTQENVEKVLGFLQDFQAKYQQSLSPQVFTFLMAKKWPVTPGTVLASWVFQDKEVRDALWNKFQDTLPEKEATAVQDKLLMNMKPDAPEILSKLKILVGQKLQGLLEKLSDLIQQSKANSQPNNNSTQLSAKMLLRNELKAHFPSGNPKSQLNQPATSESTPIRVESNGSDLKHQPLTNKTEAQNQLKLEAQTTLIKSNQSASGSKGVPSEKAVEASREKIQTVLDQNIAINQNILKETAVNGSSNLIPLLVNDSRSIIHECMVKWKEERSSNNDGSADQVVYMAIPTDNMGDINLALRMGTSGTKISFRVNSEEVRKYFLQHAAELKESIPQSNALIAVNIKEIEEYKSGVNGVDLWM